MQSQQKIYILRQKVALTLKTIAARSNHDVLYNLDLFSQDCHPPTVGGWP
jgi:hypothetical protein